MMKYYTAIDKNGKVITQSQYTILKAVACEYNCPIEERIIDHHDLVKNAIDLISTDEYSGMGTLGRKTGIRYKSYMKITRFRSSSIATSGMKTVVLHMHG